MVNLKDTFNSNFLKLIFFINVLIFFITLINVEKNIFNYFIFGLLQILYLYFILNNKISFSEFFLFTFLYLGFFFKYSISDIFYDIYILDATNFFVEMTKEDFDREAIFGKALIVSSIIFVNMFLAFRFLGKNLNIKNINNNSNQRLEKFISQNLIFYLVLLILLMLVLYAINYYFEIARRGDIENISINSKIFKFFFVIGFPYLICVIFVKGFKSYKLGYLLLILESFFSTTSLNSRAFLVNQIPYFIILFKKIKNKQFIFLSLIICLGLLSIYMVNLSRINAAIEKEIKVTKNLPVEKYSYNPLNQDADIKNYQINSAVKSIINRWVGFDALVNTLNKNYSIKIFLESFKEKEIKSETFYYKKFLHGEENFKFFINSQQYSHSQLIPGLIAYLNFSNSLIFLFLSFCILILFVFLIEKLILYITNYSMLITSVLVFHIIFRLIHFGIVPINTLIYFGAILFFPITFFLINKTIDKIYKKNDLS